MQAVQLLHKICKKSCIKIHSTRLQALFTAVSALVIVGKLSLAGLGRSLKTGAKVKNNIKRIDRLLGNRMLIEEREEFYKITARMIVGNIKSPSVIVDWSPLPDPNCYLLRAAIPMQGRSLTIYEKVYPLKMLNNHRAHKEFLGKLSKILPEDCKPIIIIDAGFHSPFFKEVNNLGWHWLGRVRNSTQYCPEGSTDWLPCKRLHKQANRTPKFICSGLQSQKTPIKCSIFLFRGKNNGRANKDKFGNRLTTRNNKYAKGNKEPWVLVTSLPGKTRIAKKVISLYKRRMQIEESFRDIKNSRLGFSLEESKTYKMERFNILLLIGMLAILAVYLLGKAGERQGIQYAFQANTVCNKSVLSLFFLGCQIVRQENIKFKKEELLMALKLLQNTMNKGAEL